MPDEADFNTVVARVQLLAQTTVDPALTTSEVEGVVRATARAQTWAAATALAYGAYVYPTAANRNGRRYRVVEAGTTGATEPTWATDAGGTFTDGTVSFEEAGPLSGSVYDVRKAVHECWMLKAARSSGRIDFSADGGSFKEQQTPAFCVEMAMKYQPLELA